jgi:hypothetical protein
MKYIYLLLADPAKDLLPTPPLLDPLDSDRFRPVTVENKPLLEEFSFLVTAIPMP